MDVSAVEDPVQRRALETMIKTYGQTPRQLFNASHISRAGTKLLSEAELPAAMGLLVQLAFRESREQPKETIYPVQQTYSAEIIQIDIKGMVHQKNYICHSRCRLVCFFIRFWEM